jgi:hypothetical protein
MKVGSLVVLNQWGLEAVFGDRADEAVASGHIIPKTMRITRIDPVPLLEEDGVEAFDVEVDDPYINQFLIDTLCFDVVPGEAANDSG